MKASTRKKIRRLAEVQLEQACQLQGTEKLDSDRSCYGTSESDTPSSVFTSACLGFIALALDEMNDRRRPKEIVNADSSIGDVVAPIRSRGSEVRTPYMNGHSPPTTNNGIFQDDVGLEGELRAADVASVVSNLALEGKQEEALALLEELTQGKNWQHSLTNVLDPLTRVLLGIDDDNIRTACLDISQAINHNAAEGKTLTAISYGWARLEQYEKVIDRSEIERALRRSDFCLRKSQVDALFAMKSGDDLSDDSERF